jgi:hypothetical protein
LSTFSILQTSSQHLIDEESIRRLGIHVHGRESARREDLAAATRENEKLPPDG